MSRKKCSLVYIVPLTCLFTPLSMKGLVYLFLKLKACDCSCHNIKHRCHERGCWKRCEFVNPSSEEDIARAMILLANNQEYRKELINKGHANTLRFSWSSFARELIKAYGE